MILETRVCTLFNIEHPIIQGGMQWTSNTELVAAVSNAGALGIITSSNFSNKEDLISEIRKVRGLTNKPVGVNISTTAELHMIQQYVEAVLEENIAIVETSGGNPANLIPRLKKSGIKVFHKIPSAKFAKKLEELGVDAIAIVGTQAGGHPGPFGVTTEIVLQETLNLVKVPVIMGGGVYNGRGLLSALSYGAEGVLLGTRLLATTECSINRVIKERMLKASSEDTVLIKSDNPNRVLKNDMAYMLLGKEKSGFSFEAIHKEMVTKKSRQSWQSEDINNYLYSMGQVVGLINEVLPVKQIINGMVKEAESIYYNTMKGIFDA